MKMIRSLTVPAIALMAWTSGASAAVEVSFDRPERYTDAGLYGDYGSKARKATMREIRRHLERLAERHLQPRQKLIVEILDIDLAGRYEPWQPHAYDVRILRDLTWPRIELRYRLEEGGTILVGDEETIADLSYLMGPCPGFASDPLRYEKAMLDRWFKRRIVERRPARH